MLKNVYCALCLCVVICVCATIAPSVMAQTASTGALVGRVMDSTGAVVPNAMVTATSRDTGQVRVGTTSSDGIYKFSLLPPGSYQIKVAAPGFSTAELEGAHNERVFLRGS
jgi:protocatechuate 3,4-dioxygenase beta subunit